MPRTVLFIVGFSSVALCGFGVSACSGSSDPFGDGGTSGGGMPTGGGSQGGSATGGGGVATGGAATGGAATGGGGSSSQGGESGNAGSASGGASGQAGGGGLGATGGSGGDAGAATGGKSGGGGMGSSCPAGCPGGECFQALDGSFGCVSSPADPIRTTCSDTQCCTADSECTGGNGGRCVSRMFMYRGCGGAVPTGNSCYYDACSTDADCPPLQGAEVHVCVPPGALGATVSVCVNGGCRTDADCTTHPNGRCLYGEAQTHGTCDRRQVFFCAYPSDPCQDRNTGCTGALICLPNETYDGRTCASPPPAYP